MQNQKSILYLVHVGFLTNSMLGDESQVTQVLIWINKERKTASIPLIGATGYFNNKYELTIN